MSVPKPDGRTAEDILSVIRQKSRVFTPEWKFDMEEPDGGTALAMLFAEMFSGTVDRFDRLPEKYFLEFLNLTGAGAKSVSPAVGTAVAELVEGAPHNVYIKKGTQLFADTADPDGESKRVIFETVSDFFATPAKISSIYMTLPQEDAIIKADLSDEKALPLRLFCPDGDNMERHVFAVAHSSVLRLTGEAEIRVKMTPSASRLGSGEHMDMLCDPEFAVWSYMGEKGKVMLKAHRENDCIVLSKPVGEVMFTDENGKAPQDGEPLPWLFCEMKKKGDTESITADGVEISSRMTADPETGRGIIPSHIFANENELDPENPVRCFGKEPNLYDSLYIECTEAFSKRGAYVTLELNVSSVIQESGTDEEEVKRRFNRRLMVNKEETRLPPPDDIFISSVSWEYWNGYGWAGLKVQGDTDLFSCRGKDGRKHISFTCPDDFEVSVHNAYRGLWLRARVREVENGFSLRFRRFIPLLKSVDIHFDYGTNYLPAEAVYTNNNCAASRSKAVAADLFRLFPDKRNTVYFMFDKAPDGLPINLYLEFAGRQKSHMIAYEYLADGHGRQDIWHRLKVSDKTRGFSDSGILSLYAPSDFAEGSLFGETGFWIRAVDMSHNDTDFPVLRSIRTNAVEIIQRERVTAERHEIPAGKIRQDILLMNKPVISCELWVNELGETSARELEELISTDKSRVRAVKDDGGQLTECWVKWEAKAALSASSESDRHYELDTAHGVIRFGDGINGRIPAYSGTVEISVDYSFGGGSCGNLPAYGLEGLVSGIPFVDRMTNFEDACGGSDGHTVDSVRKTGTKRLRHRGRAVTADDFEAIVMEEFAEVEEVRCFSGRNAEALRESGSVTVVVKALDFGSTAYSETLCRRIEAFLTDNACLVPVCGGRLYVVPAKIMRVSVKVEVRPDDYEYAAQVEEDIVKAINSAVEKTSDEKRIGAMPTVSGIYYALNGLEHVSYVGQLMLTGEYYSDGKLCAVPLDTDNAYPYFIAAAGAHTVKM
ncbi:MAG: hypothetical protein J1F60_03455 [Oscillospiraceae bacterium]|nr:hypothetical protein [Oscillospiraceae bacterium]